MATVRQDVVQIGFDIDMAGLHKLTDSLDEVKQTCTSGLGGDALDDMAKSANKASDGLEDIKKSVNGVKPDGIEDTASKLDDTDKNAGKAHASLKKMASVGFEKTISGLKSITSALGKVAVQAGKVLAKGIAAGVAGVGAVVTKSVMNFADYEQLVGGVDTMFKNVSGIVKKNASSAFKTAGLSENQYMETVTSFSASLIQSLGGDVRKAASYAHTAIVDMSDNANKMGTDMSSIQDAYQGFAKQNYTMLDNLKLGYGGTKEEMGRLLKDAQAISGIEYDVSSYADVVQAIHVIQENMGIAGTTSKEASETISGSFASMKAAWGNTLTALVLGGKKFDNSVDNLVETALTFGKNVMPAIRKSLEGVGKLITELAPIVENELPGLIDTLLPPLIKAATSLVKGLIVALPSIVSTIAKELPNILSQLWSGIKEAFGDIPGMKKMDGFFGKLNTWLTENSSIIKKVIPGIIGLVAAFKLFNKIKGLTGLFGGGGAGGAGGGFFSGLASMKPTVVLKGLGNLAIILGGLGALAAVLMWVAPYMAQLSDAKSIVEVLAVISAVGLIGSAMAGLAGLVGSIPIPVVLTGLANIALALAGFTAVAAAFGALSKVEGFNELISGGGEVLVTLSGILGEMAGSLVGGIGEGITDSLPAIGENLSAFATSIQPMFDTFSGVDVKGLGDFAGALAGLVAVIAGEKIVGVITGGIDYEGLGTKLNAMATNLSGFFTTVMTFPEGGFEKATALFNCLAGISSMPKEGGVVGWFQGEVDYTKMATGLNALAGAAGAFTSIQAIPEEAFTKMGSLFECLGGIKALPKDGGVVGWFAGEVNFASIATGIQALASGEMITALTTLSALPENAFTSLSGLFGALAGIESMPKEGGIAGWFSGDASTGLNNIASQLPGVASHIATFFTNLGGITDFTPIKSLFDTLSGIEISSDAAEGTGIFGLGASALETMGTGLSNFATNAATFFSKINGMNAGNLTTFFAELKTAGELPTALASLDGTVGTALSMMVTTVTTKMAEIKTTISTNLTDIVTMMNSTAPAMFSAGVNMMSGLNNGLLSMSGTLMATAASIATSISSTINAALDIHSPSRVTKESGINTGLGMDEGLRSTLPRLEETALEVGYASIPYAGDYSPESSSTVYNNGGNNEYTTVSPVFNLTISGTQDDRSMARKVKRYVAEAINETFESLGRKTAAVREV